ncbi:hypothetical protein TSAR_000806 [Trichomalopsis sarcophagae]|uniref:Uncharacterized protein n=1 Tax=Trichomalopsis sarcophagae TaxID=543379 RepID=A0A232FLZ0_9HYME|nr:hypothetical protein TSAR_000806 [Trichomalopsis sarcophagae]
MRSYQFRGDVRVSTLLNNACKLKLRLNSHGVRGSITTTAERPFSPPYYLCKDEFSEYSPQVAKNESSCGGGLFGRSNSNVLSKIMWLCV